jgi:capsular exopolysaccharide synthesis family protein
MQQDRSVRYYWELVLRRLWLLLAVFAGVTATVFLAGARQRPVFRSNATLLVSQDGPSSDPMYLFGSGSGATLTKRPILVNHIEILKSYSIAKMVATDLPEAVRTKVARCAPGDPAPFLQKSISVKPVRDADIISFSVSAGDPDLARILATAYVDAYRTFNLNRSRADVSAIKEFVGAQLELVGERLDSAETRLEEYKRTHRVADIEQETRATVDRQTQVLSLYEQTRAERAGIEQELSYLRGRLDSAGAGAGLSFDNASSPLVENLRNALAQLEVERMSLMVQGYTAASFRAQALSDRIAEIKKQLEDELSGFVNAGGAIDAPGQVRTFFNRMAELEPERERLRAAEGALAGVVDAYDGELRALPGRERSLARITREVEVGRQVHMLLAQRYEEARIQEAGRLSTVGVIDRPMPGLKVKPNHRNDAVMALLLGLLLAFSTVFAVDYLDTTVRRPEDLERQGFSVLASVPRIVETEPAPGPLAGRQPGAPAVESFRVLRTNLQFAFGAQGSASAGSKLTALVVTSPGAGEGKSTVASNLAMVLNQAGRRTLLIDADLRRPKQHSIHGQRKKPGLTDVVMLGVPLEKALFRSSSAPDPSGLTQETNGSPSALDVLFAGTTPPSPVDFLNSSVLHDFIERMTKEYDCLVLDTPPVLVSADAAVLAARASGVVLVARMGKTDWRALDEARKLLAQAGARTLGVVANELNVTRGYGYYRYKYHYYHYRYGRQQPAAV